MRGGKNNENIEHKIKERTITTVINLNWAETYCVNDSNWNYLAVKWWMHNTQTQEKRHTGKKNEINPFTHSLSLTHTQDGPFIKCKCDDDFEYCDYMLFGLNKWEWWWQVQGFAINIIYLDLHDFYNLKQTTVLQQLPGGIFSCFSSASWMIINGVLCWCLSFNVFRFLRIFSLV